MLVNEIPFAPNEMDIEVGVGFDKGKGKGLGGVSRNLKGRVADGGSGVAEDQVTVERTYSLRSSRGVYGLGE